MSFTFNGNTPSAINFNGQAVSELQFNGVTVWTARKSYDLGSYGTHALDVYGDSNGNYNTEKWANGSTLVAMSGQTLTVTYSYSEYHNGMSGYVDIYLRDTSGNRTKLARLGNNDWYDDESNGTDLTTPKTFTLPSSGNYYIDFYLLGRGYLTGTYQVTWTISSVTVS